MPLNDGFTVSTESVPSVPEKGEENIGFWKRSKFAIVVFALQILFLVLFAVFAEYRYNVEVEGRWFYPMFQNVHVMMFIGFGFLMTFLKKYGYSAVSINFLIAALVIQWHIIFKALIHPHEDDDHEHSLIRIGLVDLINADFASATVLISFGAVIGKTSPLQLILMAVIEIMIFAANEYIAIEIFQATDIGGSMVVHIFGAYFGLAVARVIHKPEHSASTNESSGYHSDMSSMIGTIFLWLYWPSFNSAVAGTEEQQIRAVINTYLALASCVLVTFAVSSLVDHKARFSMEHIQNSTLAGGVAVGTAANFMLHPWGSVVVGSIAGVISVLGYSYLQPFLKRKLKLHDTCGVHNLHGMPGVLAAIVGAVAATCANTESYKKELYEVFPAMKAEHSIMGRTGSQQGAYQAATLGVTLLLALTGGAITGVFLRFIPGLDAPEGGLLFSDEKHFEVPDDFQHRSGERKAIVSDTSKM